MALVAYLHCVLNRVCLCVFAQVRMLLLPQLTSSSHSVYGNILLNALSHATPKRGYWLDDKRSAD